jgi:hypothetical protein
VVALDLHGEFSRAVSSGSDGTILDDRRVRHENPEKMEQSLLESEKGTDVVIEAACNRPWIAGCVGSGGPGTWGFRGPRARLGRRRRDHPSPSMRPFRGAMRSPAGRSA